MNPQLYQRLKPLFSQAVKLSTRDRAAFLDQACAGDQTLRDALDDLLAHDRTELPEAALHGGIHPVPPPPPDPIEVGPFTILEKVGEGGMGTVYLAEQHAPIQRRVAVKLIRPGVDSSEVLARFEAERQALARMEHPNIATVLDAGTTADGRPYFAMEWVRGDAITTYCQDHGLGIRERLALFADGCDAIQHAHWKGVIHRDIKPGNILVASVDGSHVVKVIDFGIAKAIASDGYQPLTDRPLQTHIGQVIGTPLYASPEQVERGSGVVDFRSDVYSLGALLYELLTGQTPIDQERATTATFAELLHMIRDVSPLRPSARECTGEHTASPQMEAVAWTRRSLRGDLDWITMRALEKEPDRRYDTPGALADDVRRYLANEPVHAGPPTVSYRLKKFVKRNRGLVAGAAVGVVVVALGLWLLTDRVLVQRVDGLIETLTEAELPRVPELARELAEIGPWTTAKLATAMTAANSPDAQTRLSVALLPSDPSLVADLLPAMLEAPPQEFVTLRTALHPHRQDINPELWSATEDPQRHEAIRFKAMVALASLDPSNDRWDDPALAQRVVDRLVGVLPSELGPWREALAPVRSKLQAPLLAYYRDSTRPAEKRLFATAALTNYAAAEPARLFELLLEADPTQFEIVFGALVKHRAAAVELAEAAVKQEVDRSVAGPTRARRAANAGVALLLLDRPEAVWPLLRQYPDPNNRGQLIDRIVKCGVSPVPLVEHYLATKGETDVRCALLLALGGLEPVRLAATQRRALTERVTHDYRNDPDAGLHGAARFWFRSWSIEPPKLAASAATLPGEESTREWFAGALGMVFSIVEPAVFTMGSPGHETGRHVGEILHRRDVDRRFAIATHELTRAQWREFCRHHTPFMPADGELIEQYAPTEDCPQLGMTFFGAASFCNWLSELDGIDPEQWCYEPNAAGKYGIGMRARDNYLNLVGYRLPTEAEWELACRAGSTTSRHYGDDPALLANYAVYLDIEGQVAWPVGSLMPNDLGLFDMLGNAYEWCDTPFEEWPDDIPAVIKDTGSTTPVTNDVRRALRGGAYNMRAIVCRSAYRNGIAPDRSATITGMRPVRTLR